MPIGMGLGGWQVMDAEYGNLIQVYSQDREVNNSICESGTRFIVMVAEMTSQKEVLKGRT
jgi:hypothetical protein